MRAICIWTRSNTSTINWQNFSSSTCRSLHSFRLIHTYRTKQIRYWGCTNNLGPSSSIGNKLRVSYRSFLSMREECVIANWFEKRRETPTNVLSYSAVSGIIQATFTALEIQFSKSSNGFGSIWLLNCMEEILHLLVCWGMYHKYWEICSNFQLFVAVIKSLETCAVFSMNIGIKVKERMCAGLICKYVSHTKILSSSW